MTLRTGLSLGGCVLLLVGGQILVKHGLMNVGGFTLRFTGLGQEITRVIGSFHVWAGLCLTGMATLLWFDLLSRVELSYAYPMLSTSYLLMILASWVFLREPPSLIRCVGVIIIFLGVVLVSRS